VLEVRGHHAGAAQYTLREIWLAARRPPLESARELAPYTQLELLAGRQVGTTHQIPVERRGSLSGTQHQDTKTPTEPPVP